jgi:peptidoglycan/LPS O-acetylase OafA/YrhL
MHSAAGRPDPYGSVSNLVHRWEHVMRIRFFSYLAMGIISAFLIVGSYAFADGTFMWIAFAGGIALACIAIFDAVSSRRRPLTAVPAGVIAIVGVVMAVLAVTLAEANVGDAAFGMSIATGILSAIGLWGHELQAERDVRMLVAPQRAQ